MQGHASTSPLSIFSHPNYPRTEPLEFHPHPVAKGLTRKQQVFVAEYLKDCNATRAAISAGYSERRASVAGAELVANRKVSAEIDRKLEKKLGKLDITVEKVLAELGKLAFLDPRKFYDENGNLKPITELDDETAACLAGMEVNELWGEDEDGRKPVGTVKKIKFTDKGINLERLGRYFKLFTDRVENRDLTLERLICGDDD